MGSAKKNSQAAAERRLHSAAFSAALAHTSPLTKPASRASWDRWDLQGWASWVGKWGDRVRAPLLVHSAATSMQATHVYSMADRKTSCMQEKTGTDWLGSKQLAASATYRQRQAVAASGKK